MNRNDIRDRSAACFYTRVMNQRTQRRLATLGLRLQEMHHESCAMLRGRGR